MHISIHTHTYNPYTHTQTHNRILFSHKNEWNNAACSKMVGPTEYRTKWSKSKTNIYHLHVIYKNDTNELIYKTGIASQT